MGIRAGCGVAALLAGTLVVGQGSAAGEAMVRDADREAVIDAFYDTWLSNQQVPIAWTGSIHGCTPGEAGDASLAATRRQINYFRRLAGLRKVTLDDELGRTAQRTALIMDANDQLSHDPPAWWACHTKSGADLAGRANLALGTRATGPRAVTAFMADSAHTAVAHRRWVLNPRTAQMAAGSTGAASALVVVGMPKHSRPVPTWVPWPPAGYFPAPLEPDGVWSLSTTRSGIDLAEARVRVTDGAGRKYAVTRFAPAAAGGPATLVWRVADLRRPTLRRDVRYRVRVSGLERFGAPLKPVSWTVTLVKPDRPTALVERPVVRGSFQVGRELYVSPGAWSPTPAKWRYQWLRDGAPIPSASWPLYWPTASDVGHVLSVRVEARATYYVPGAVTVPGAVVTG